MDESKTKQVTALLPSTDEWKIMSGMASTLMSSGLFPTAVDTKEKALVIALKGRELGIPMMVSLNHINVIDGKPSISSELMLSLIYERCPDSDIEFTEMTDKVCSAIAHRPGKTDKKYSLTLEEAQKRGFVYAYNKKTQKTYLKANWKNFPDSMLKARVVSFLGKVQWPDILMGCSNTPDELDQAEPVGGEKEVSEPVDVTQAPDPKAPVLDPSMLSDAEVVAKAEQAEPDPTEAAPTSTAETAPPQEPEKEKKPRKPRAKKDGSIASSQKTPKPQAKKEPEPPRPDDAPWPDEPPPGVKMETPATKEEPKPEENQLTMSLPKPPGENSDVGAGSDLNGGFPPDLLDDVPGVAAPQEPPAKPEPQPNVILSTRGAFKIQVGQELFGKQLKDVPVNELRQYLYRVDKMLAAPENGSLATENNPWTQFAKNARHYLQALDAVEVARERGFSDPK